MSDAAQPSNDDEKRIAPRLGVTTEGREGFVLITVSGHVVELTALTLEVHLARALTGRPPNLVLLTSAVTAMDETAAMLLDAAAQIAVDRGGFLRLVAPSAAVWTAVETLRSATLSTHRNVADALQNRGAVLSANSGEHGPLR
ncbi:STAS domain-containing protein [Dactylosporangium sp. NPDC049525]|uniref:STAS domain-containing protein n=1 Tax=Dactylosporangium sp. NPDC049525 TaxID=3154730 RepID=UPI0034330B3D